MRRAVIGNDLGVTTVAAERYDATTMADGSVWEIDDGWDVVGVDGVKAGVIRDIEPDYIVISRGFLFPTERFIPVDAITNVEPGRVYLNVSRREIEERGWTAPPVGADAAAWDGAAPYGFADIAAVSGGAVDGLETLDRRLDEEQIQIDRQPVDDGSGVDVAWSFAHLEMAVPIYGEVAVVHKRPVVYEMFGITRGFRERQQQFRDVVRREEVQVTADTA